MTEPSLDPTLVAVDVPAADREAAVRAAGNLLVGAGAVEPRYVEAMLRVLDTHGPYIVIAPGIALPHATPEDGVLRTAISVATLREPVTFGHQANDPVRLVVALAPVDKHAHLSALQQIAQRLGDREVVDGLHAATTADEVVTLLAG